MTTNLPQCPRCTGPIPDADAAFYHRGATSRTDNATEICSDCGTDEALRVFASARAIPQTEWPITNRKPKMEVWELK
jgi:hypothetical protein